MQPKYYDFIGFDTKNTQNSPITMGHTNLLQPTSIHDKDECGPH